MRIELTPAWPWRLPAAGADGVARRRGSVLERLLWVGEGPVLVRVAALTGGRAVLGAWAPGRRAAALGVARMRLALGLDDDLRLFHERFRWDPVIGPLLRADPALRVARRPDAFEALAWAICEQLIDYHRAVGIQRRLVARLGRRCRVTELRLPPGAEALHEAGSAALEACGLSPARSRALVLAAREVRRGRLDLGAEPLEAGWRRLRAIPGIGPWTVEMLALRGQGRLDQVPAGDLGLLKALGRARHGDPRARVEPEAVRELLAGYHPYGGLAAAYLLRAGPRRAAELLRLGAGPAAALTGPDRAAADWSAPRRPRAAA